MMRTDSWFHKYEVMDSNYERERITGANRKTWVILVLYGIIMTGMYMMGRGDTTTALTYNKQWETAYTSLTGEKDRALDKASQLLMKYENLQCSVRGLTLTTVKGITLCMDPNTKALHKIDATAD